MNSQTTAAAEPVTVSTGGWNGQTGPEVKHAIPRRARTERTKEAIRAYNRLLQAEDAAAIAQSRLDDAAARLTNEEADDYARATIEIDEARAAREEKREEIRARAAARNQ